MTTIRFFLLCMAFLPCLSLLAQKRAKTFDYTNVFYDAETLNQLENKLDRIVTLFSGHYSNRAQADTANSPLYREQEIICVPIFKDKRVGEHWIYIGWFAANSYQKPLAHAIFQIRKKDRDTLELVGYHKLPKEVEKENYSWEWIKEKPFDQLDFKAMLALNPEPCTYPLIERKIGQVAWLRTQPCHDEISDLIHYHDVSADCSQDYIRFYSRFLDANQEYRFGYDQNPIGQQFDRINKDQSKQKVKVLNTNKN